MTSKSLPRDEEARVGDWLHARGVHGDAGRRGEITEILGGPGHQHYRVRWDEAHESIVFPADGVSIERPVGRHVGDRASS